MYPVVWISFVILLHLGQCQRFDKEVRHQRTRYLTLGSHYLTANSSGAFHPDSRPLGQAPQPSPRGPQSSRPLFSWDTPTNELSAAAPVNYRGNISTVKPMIWHGRKKPKQFLKRVKVASKSANHSGSGRRSNVNSVSFRKSYVYKAVPTEEERLPTQSKKVIYVVSKAHGRANRRKGKQRRKQCKNPRNCPLTEDETVRYKPSKRRYEKWNSSDNNEVITTGSGRRGPSNVEHFPKGLIAQGIDELRNSWNRKWNKGDAKGEEDSRRDREPYPSGFCTSAPEKCEQICTEEDGRAQCSCYAGFVLLNGTKCADIDECQVNNGGCDGKCINTIGSRRCLCPEGYRLSPSDNKCIDINECLLRNGHGPCQDICINTKGGYYCSCDGLKGTVLSRDNHTCEEVNDCNSGAAGCSHSCISTFGRSFCTCPDGYELGEDWKTCHDIDECADAQENARCEFGCINTIGSYYCEVRNTVDQLRSL